MDTGNCMYIDSGLLLLCPDLVGITFCTSDCQICPGAEAIVRGCYLPFLCLRLERANMIASLSRSYRRGEAAPWWSLMTVFAIVALVLCMLPFVPSMAMAQEEDSDGTSEATEP